MPKTDHSSGMCWMRLTCTSNGNSKRPALTHYVLVIWRTARYSIFQPKRDKAHREDALRRRNPQIRATRIKNHGELLRRGTDANLPKVLSVQIVLEGNNIFIFLITPNTTSQSVPPGHQILPLLIQKPGCDPAILTQRFLPQTYPNQSIGGTSGRESQRKQEDRKKERNCETSTPSLHDHPRFLNLGHDRTINRKQDEWD